MVHSGLIEKLVHAMPHKFGVTESENLGDALIHCADFAVQRNRKNQMIEAVDQVSITLPGIRNNFSKLLQLFSAGRRILHLLDSAGIAAQFYLFAETVLVSCFDIVAGVSILYVVYYLRPSGREAQVGTEPTQAP